MRRSIIHKCRLSSATRIGCWLVAAAGILGVIAFGQQSQREYIYMGGKALATESAAFSAPVITLTSPTSGSSYDTYLNSITLAGSASDSSGISGVSWVNSRGGSGNCTGTTSWTCSGINLLLGQNVVTITAWDNQNSYAVDTLSVNYCTYTLSSYSVNAGAGAGSGTINNSCVGGCAWTAVSNAPAWITVIAGGSVVGSGFVGYSITANTGPARTGTITIAGQTFTINQASGCPYTLNPTSAGYPVTGGTGTITVTTNSLCPRTVSNSLSWVDITGGNGSNGSGPVTYSVAPNDIPLRSGFITIGNANFSIGQAANPYCGDGICQENSSTCPQDCSSCNQTCVNNCIAGNLPGYYCMVQCGCSQ
jgi:hypothetical protein